MAFVFTRNKKFEENSRKERNGKGTSLAEKHFYNVTLRYITPLVIHTGAASKLVRYTVFIHSERTIGNESCPRIGSKEFVVRA